MKTVYVAGPYSHDNVLGVFAHMRAGIKASAALIQNGFAPFCPWSDILMHLQCGYDLETCYGYSLEWLIRSDILYVAEDYFGMEEGVKHWKDSIGTQEELKKAEELQMPIYYTIDELFLKEHE